MTPFSRTLVRPARLALLLALGAPLALAPRLAPAQGAQTVSNTTATADAPARAIVPFVVGERLTYNVKFGIIKAGEGTMEVAGIDTVRGRETYRISFRLKGGVPFYRVDDTYASWIDTRTLSSLRYHQDIDEGRYERVRKFEIFPEDGYFLENDRKKRNPTVSEPLDDGSFLYFIRTMPFSVGQTYTFNRYFKPDRNPVTIRVLRKERVEVPAGTFDCIVVQPLIKTKGIFSEGGRAEVWITDDDRRMIVQLKSQISKIGSLSMYLTSPKQPKS